MTSTVRISKGTWRGPHRKGEKCVVLSSAKLKVTILLKGAFVISVVDRETGGDFINNGRKPWNREHGIYDRVAWSGSPSSIGKNRKHFAVTPYAMEKAGPGALRFSAARGNLSIERTIVLDPVLPKLSMNVKQVSLCRKMLKTTACLFAQMDLAGAGMVYNQAAVLPEGDSLKTVTVRNGGLRVSDPRSGWWFVADRETKKSVIMTHPVDGSVGEIYQYRTPEWVHFLPFGPGKVFMPGESRELSQEYFFLGAPRDVHKLMPAHVSSVSRDEFSRMKKALRVELKKKAVLPGQRRRISVPRDYVPVPADPSPRGKPEATVIMMRAGIYDHPSVKNALLFTSLDDTLRGMLDAGRARADAIIVTGVSANGEICEFNIAKRAARAVGLRKVVWFPSEHDAGSIEEFDRILGRNTRNFRIKDVNFICHVPGRSRETRKAIRDAGDERTVIVGDNLPRNIPSDTSVTLALFRQDCDMPVFARVGKWPVLWNPPLHESYPTILVINIFSDCLEVAAKPVGGAFGPRIYLDRYGKSPTLGIPTFVTGKPRLRVAHISDTQLGLPSRLRTRAGKPLDQENMKQAVREINGLGVDFVVNTGDLVNRGSVTAQWHLYARLRDKLKPPLYEILGNHDVSDIILLADGSVRYVVDHYLKHALSPRIYGFVRKDILFVGFDMSVTSDDLRRFKEMSRKCRCTVLMYHDPIHVGEKVRNWWRPELEDAAFMLKPSIMLAGHTHRLEYFRKNGVPEFVGSALGWTFMNDQEWNGYFIHTFYDDRVVSSFKRLCCDDMFFTVVTPYL